MAKGSNGRIKFYNDFTAPPGGITTGVPDALFQNLGGGVGLIGVNEGVLALTVDEPGGVISITTDTGDNDNHCLVAGAFKPSDGGFWMETRLKIGSVAATKVACFVGFTETLSAATPVMPAETATVTTTYNGTGGMAGFVFDSDATSIKWRFVAGDGGAALATSNAEHGTGTAGGAIGIDAAATITADKYWLFRLVMTPDGICRGYFGDADNNKQLKFVGRNTSALGTGDNFHAIALIENRDANAEVMEVDYFEGEAYRNWAP